MNTKPLTIALCAGEASGDFLGAELMHALQKRHPHIQFIGIGGTRMQAAGMDCYFPQERLAVRGFVEILKHLPDILSIRRQFIRLLMQNTPDVFIGIDSPDFNLGIAEQLKKQGIPTIQYVSPSIWAWRKNRIDKIIQQVDEVLCLFPMEPPLYHRVGGRATFVGHPLARKLAEQPSKLAMRQHLKLADHTPVFVLLPGSRVSEIHYMAPLFLQAAQKIHQQLPDAKFLLPVATTATHQCIQTLLQQKPFQTLPIRIMFSHAEMACIAADAALVASGTATLEVALCRCPMVISYRISPITYTILKHAVKIPYIGLPNILSQQKIVPELIQNQATPNRLAEALLDWYAHPEKAIAIQQAYTQLHQQLSSATEAHAAEIVLRYAQGIHHV